MARRLLKFPAVAVAIAVSAGGALPVFLVGSLSVEEGHSLGINPSHVAALIALFFASASISAAVMGHVADRFGGVKVMTLGASGTSLGALIASLSPSVWIFSGGIVLAGLGYGAGQPAVSKFLAENVRVSKQGIAFGLRQTGVPLATLLAGLAVSATSGNQQWRLVFVFAAIFAVLTVLLLRTRNSGVSTTLGIKEKKVHVASQTKEVGWPILVLLGLVLGLGAGTIYVIASFAVLSARQIGLSVVDAGYLAATGGVLALIFRVSTGFLADLLHFEPLRVAGLMLLCGSVGYWLLSFGTKDLAVMGIVVAFSVGSGWNALFLLSLARDFPGNSGRATGVGLAGAYAGGVLGPLIFGFALANYGFSTAWHIEAIAAILAGLGALLAWALIGRLNVANQF